MRASHTVFVKRKILEHVRNIRSRAAEVFNDLIAGVWVYYYFMRDRATRIVYTMMSCRFIDILPIHMPMTISHVTIRSNVVHYDSLQYRVIFQLSSPRF